MAAKKTSNTSKNSKVKIETTKPSDTQKTKKLSRKEKMHEKVENYVYKNRDKTSQKIIEKRNKRPAENYKEADLEAMISRVSLENNPDSVKKDSNKGIIYLLYIIVIIVVLIIIMKGFMGYMSQIG